MFLDANKNGVFEASEVGIGYTYNSKNQLSAITTPSTTYSFAYNSFGNASNIGIAGRPSLASYTYNSYNGKLKRTTYGNGFYVENDYDHLDRVVGIKYNGTTKFTFAYNGDGGLHSKTDLVNNTTTYYEYDSLGRLIRGREMSGSTLKLGVENQFDSYGRPKSTTYDFGEFTQKNTVNYVANSNLISSFYFQMQGTYNPYVSYGYDKFERLISETYIEDDYDIVKKACTYYDGVDPSKTTNLVRTETFNGYSRHYWYMYDNVGNITSINYNAEASINYVYDSLNQLIREDNPKSNRSYTYEYDKAGNILYKRTYAYTTGTLGTPISTTPTATTTQHGAIY